MQLKHLDRWLPVFIILVFAIGWKSWQHQARSNQPRPSQVDGPAVILFRGANAPDCRAVYHLVNQAAARHGTHIEFVRLNRGSDRPLMAKYDVHAVPAVVIVDRQDKEVRQIVGDSPAVRRKLGRALAQVGKLVQE